MAIFSEDFKARLERLSLVDLTEEVEEGRADADGGALRTELLKLMLAVPVNTEMEQKFPGAVFKWSRDCLRIEYESGEKYSVSYQPDSEIVNVIREDTLRVCTPEETKTIDDVLGMVLMPSYRILKADFDTLAEQAKSQGLTVPALVRRLVHQEAAAIREGKAQFEVSLAGNV